MQLTTLARRRFVEHPSRNPSWDSTHKVADKHYPALRALFVGAWDAMAATLDEHALARELVAGNLPAVLVLLEQAWATSTDVVLRDQLRTLMTRIVEQGAVASQPALTALLRPTVAITFDAASPFVLDFVHNHSATLIRDIGLETRQAIRAMLMRNMESGKSWRSLVPEIRETIGVTVRQADALVTQRGVLEAQGMNEAVIDRLIAQKTRAYKQLRARTIARDQSMLSANAGQFLHIQALVTQGVMDPTQYRRHLVLTPDERTCTTVCVPTRRNHPNGVGLLEPFQTPQGPKMYPPLHVICRCTAATRAARSL